MRIVLSIPAAVILGLWLVAVPAFVTLGLLLVIDHFGKYRAELAAVVASMEAGRKTSILIYNAECRLINELHQIQHEEEIDRELLLERLKHTAVVVDITQEHDTLQSERVSA